MRIKGRLGEIELKFNNTTDTLYIPYEDVKFLIEQAERVYELEQQNKRYYEALEFYADRGNYEPEHYDPDTHDYTSIIYHDKGATARKALKGGREMNEFCPTCSGSGGIEVLDGSIGEVVTIPCPDCEGSGESAERVEKSQQTLEGEK